MQQSFVFYVLHQDGNLDDEDGFGAHDNDQERVRVFGSRTELLVVGDFDEVHLDELVNVIYMEFSTAHLLKSKL